MINQKSVSVCLSSRDNDSIDFRDAEVNESDLGRRTSLLFGTSAAASTTGPLTTDY